MEESELGQQSGGQQGQESASSQQGNSPGDRQPQQIGRAKAKMSAGTKTAAPPAPARAMARRATRALPGSGGEDQGADTDNNPSGRGQINTKRSTAPAASAAEDS